MAEKFYWDNPSTALHLQTSIPLKVQVGAKVFATKSWSLSGFRLINFHAKQTELIGKTFPATLQVHFRDFNISIDTVAVVKEYSLETQELEAEFKVLKEEHKELLRYFIQSIVSGEMASIDNIIRRVDMPVESPTIKIPTAEASAKTGIISMSSLYWLACCCWVICYLVYIAAVTAWKSVPPSSAEKCLQYNPASMALSLNWASKRAKQCKRARY